MAMELLSIATALPQHDMAQSAAARFAEPLCCNAAEHRRLLPVLYRRTRVKRRSSVLLEEGNGSDPVQDFYAPAEDEMDRGPTTHERMARYHQEAPRLARRASIAALTDAGVRADRVTHLITVSCTGFEAPGCDIALIKQLPLRPNVARTHIGFMGCHGAFNGIQVARAFTEAGAGAVVLLCAVELCSLHFHYGWDPQQIVANALFADGAAALVGVTSVDSVASANRRWRVSANGSCILPQSEDAMTWQIGDHGFVMTLSSRVPDLIQTHLGPWLDRWLAGCGLSVSQIGSWAVHPGGPRILSAVADALNLSDDQLEPSRQVLSECGNMSSPTILFILDRLQKQDAKRPCLAIGFGPGLAVETVLLI